MTDSLYIQLISYFTLQSDSNSSSSPPRKKKKGTPEFQLRIRAPEFTPLNAPTDPSGSSSQGKRNRTPLQVLKEMIHK